MGGGSSNSKLWSLFVNAELVDGSKYLAGDPDFRSVFIEYVRCGQWKDRLSNITSDDKPVELINRFSKLNNAWLEYKFPPGVVADMGQGLKPESLVQSPRASIRRSFDYIADKSICTGFTLSQLTAVMFSILYPLFASTPDEVSTPHSSSESECSNKVTSDRVLEILASCAEELSEADMHEFLEDPKWVFETSDAFEDFPLSITICDTARPGCPIVYANKAFQTLSGYAPVDLIGSSLDILHGVATQEVQVNLLQAAMSTGQLTKIGVTHYNKKQKPFLNLIAMRSCAHYSVAVHFAATASAHPEDLKAVDDLLLLVCCVLQAPMLKPAPSPSTLTPVSLIRRSLALVKRSFDGGPSQSSKNIRNSVSTKSTTRSSTSSSSSSFNSVGSDKSAINLARLMAVRMSMSETIAENAGDVATERVDEAHEMQAEKV